jgi:hypothetical protein
MKDIRNLITRLIKAGALLKRTVQFPKLPCYESIICCDVDKDHKYKKAATHAMDTQKRMIGTGIVVTSTDRNEHNLADAMRKGWIYDE